MRDEADWATFARDMLSGNQPRISVSVSGTPDPYAFMSREQLIDELEWRKCEATDERRSVKRLKRRVKRLKRQRDKARRRAR